MQEGERGFCQIVIFFVFLVKACCFFTDKGGRGSNFFIFSLTSYLHDPIYIQIYQ